jgi:hypothetical protein
MLTALVTGIALVGINTSLHTTDAVKYAEPDHGKVGVKFLILLVILVLTFKNKKKTDPLFRANILARKRTSEILKSKNFKKIKLTELQLIFQL